jgi:hypothetical protein
MAKRNVIIAVIIIVLFIILAIIGFAIYAVHNGVSIFTRRRPIDEEME